MRYISLQLYIIYNVISLCVTLLYNSTLFITLFPVVCYIAIVAMQYISTRKKERDNDILNSRLPLTKSPLARIQACQNPIRSPREQRLSRPFMAPPSIPVYDSAVRWSEGFQGAINWVPMMPREASSTLFFAA